MLLFSCLPVSQAWSWHRCFLFFPRHWSPATGSNHIYISLLFQTTPIILSYLSTQSFRRARGRHCLRPLPTLCLGVCCLCLSLCSNSLHESNSPQSIYHLLFLNTSSYPCVLSQLYRCRLFYYLLLHNSSAMSVVFAPSPLFFPVP